MEENKEHNKQHGLQVNEISEKTKVSFRTRVITGAVLIALVIPCVILGDFPFAVLVLLAVGISIYEFITVLKSQKHFIWIDIFTFIMTISFIYWVIIKGRLQSAAGFLDADGHIMFNNISISTLGIALMICVLFFASFLTKKFNVPDVCYYVTMSIVISLGFQAIYFLRYVPISGIGNIEPYKYGGNYFQSCLLFAYFIIGTCFTDIGAYAIGILFGKHKMNPRISPNKTWEGFYGGLIVSFVLSFLFGFLVSYFNIPLLKGVLDIEHWYWILLISAIMPLASVVGDFMFSAIKRHYGVKDFSKILPGHGGVLDRIDSVLINAIVVTMIILTIAHFPFV